LFKLVEVKVVRLSDVRSGRTRPLVLAVVLLLWAAGLAHAQVLYGSITGSVRDSTGAALPGATVRAVHTATNLAREAVTNEQGVYTILNLPQGTYTVTVSLQGFREFTQQQVPVTVNQITRLDATLEVGQIAETITVTAESSILQTDKGSISAELRSEEITNLPLANYRNFQKLYDLLPGATPTNFQNAVMDTPARALTTNINGTARNNNNVRQDGAANIYIWLPHHAAYIAPAESIDTVNVSTNAFDAEQGMAGGAAVTVVTKSGTNQLRGSAFEFHDNNRLKSNNFFDPPGFKQPAGSRNIFGGTLGGPVRRDHVFFFGSYEGTIERVSRSLNASVPPAALREGDFSGITTIIYDPLTGTPDGRNRLPFPGNRIPRDRIHPVARQILEMIPLPNREGPTNNYFVTREQKLDRHNLDVKLNWNRTAQHQIWGKYGHMDALAHCDQAFGIPGGGPGVCDAGYGDGDTVVKVFTLGHTWTFGSNVVMDGTFGLTDMNQNVTSEDMGRNFGLDVLRLPGTNGPDPRQSGMPVFFTGFSGFGNQEGWIPIYRDDRSYTFNTNVSWLAGAHDVRFGFDLVQHQLNHWQPEIDNPRGAFSFGGGATALNGGAAPNLFNSFAAFLLGLPSTVSKSLQFEEMTAREWQYAFYIRDRWQVSQKLTLNYGVRFERYPLMRRANRGIETIDWAAVDRGEGMFVLLGGRGGNPEDLGIDVKYPWAAPRLGAAYRLNEDTVIRGGYGLTIDPIPFARPLRGFYPLTIAQAFVADSPFGWVRPLSAGIPELSTPDPNAARVALPGTAAMRSPRDEIHRGFIHSWNVMFERRLPFDFVVDVGYVGTATREALLDLDVNAAGPGEGQLGRPLRARFGRTAATTAWGLGKIAGCEKCFQADYHALQVAVNRPFRDGLLVKGAYTLSRAKNAFSGGPFGGGDDVGWAGMAWNHPSVLDKNYALAGYDRTHIFSLGFVAELPFRSETSRALNAVISGWQVNGIFQAASGTPFNVTSPGASLNAPGNTQLADRVGEPRRTGKIQKDATGAATLPFYDPSAWRAVTEVRFGNETRNSVRGPGFTNFDFSLFRNFTLVGTHEVEFRLEVFNLFNSPRWFNPIGDVSNPRFMQITGSNRAFDRQVRFGLRYAF
jgi:flavin-binding protein dodecin